MGVARFSFYARLDDARSARYSVCVAVALRCTLRFARLRACVVAYGLRCGRFRACAFCAPLGDVVGPFVHVCGRQSFSSALPFWMVRGGAFVRWNIERAFSLILCFRCVTRLRYAFAFVAFALHCTRLPPCVTRGYAARCVVARRCICCVWIASLPQIDVCAMRSLRAHTLHHTTRWTLWGVRCRCVTTHARVLLPLLRCAFAVFVLRAFCVALRSRFAPHVAVSCAGAHSSFVRCMCVYRATRLGAPLRCG